MSIKNENKIILQAPFRSQDLLSADRFISYCHERGIDTDLAQLEFYEKEKLLFPAIRVFRPFYKVKEVFANGVKIYTPLLPKEKYTGKIFYSIGSYYNEEKNWFKNYDFNFPSKNKFTSWKTFEHNIIDLNDDVIAKNIKELGTPADNFYTYRQAFILEFIKSNRQFIVSDPELATVQSDSDWIKFGQEVRLMFANPNRQNKLREHIGEYYRIFLVLNDFDEKKAEINADCKIFYDKAVRNYGQEVAKKDLNYHIQSVEKKEIPKFIDIIFDNYGLTASKILSWAELFAHRGYMKDQVASWRTWRPKIPPKRQLSNVSGQMLFVRDCYTLADNLLVLYNSVAENEVTLQYLLRGVSDYKNCVVCKNPFQPTKKGGKPQVTCSEKCSKKYKKQLIYSGRKTGKYKKSVTKV